MRVYAIAAILVVFTAAFVVAFVRDYMSIPTAVFSHKSNQCVKLISTEGSKTPCGVLPERYHKEWTR